MEALILIALAAAPDPALMDRIAQRAKALESFSQNAQFTLKVVSDELDSDGKSKKHEELAFLVKRIQGKPERTLLNATEDGKDVTEDKRKELAKEEAKNGKSQASPFHPDERTKYAFSMLAPAPAEPKYLRIAFQPAGEKTSEQMIGDATVDPETGDMVRMSMRPAKNPTFVDRLFLELEFDAPTPVGRGLSKLVAKGAGGIAFIKKRFAVTTTFSDYQPSAPTPTTAPAPKTKQ